MPLGVISDLSNLLRSLMQLTSLQALDLDCSHSKLQELPQPMQATLLPAFPHLQHLTLKSIRPALLGYNSPAQLAHDLSMLPELSSLHFHKDTLSHEIILPLFLLLTGQHDPIESTQESPESSVPSSICSTLRQLTLHQTLPTAGAASTRPQPRRILHFFSRLEYLQISCKSPLPLISSPEERLQQNGAAVAYLPSSLTQIKLQQPLKVITAFQILLQSSLATHPTAVGAAVTPMHASLRSLSFCLPQSFWVLPPDLAESLKALTALQELTIDVKRFPKNPATGGMRGRLHANSLTRRVRGVLCATLATLQNLSSLHLSVCSLDCPAALAALQQLSKLQDLHLDDSCWRPKQLDTQGAGRTAYEIPGEQQELTRLRIGALPLAHLVHVDTFHADVPADKDAMASAAADTLASLTKLTALHAFAPRLWVTEAQGVASGVTVASALGRLTGLRMLCLECKVGRGSALPLSRALRELVELTELSLVGLQLFETRGVFFQKRFFPHVGGAVIVEAQSGHEVAVVFAQSLRKLTGLNTLRLDGNDMTAGEGIVEVVVRGVIAPGLEVLSLRDTGVTEEQVHALRQKAIAPKTVVHLDAR
jgi:hypothetical protein